MNEQQSQNLLLKVYPLSTIRSNKLISQGGKLETSTKSVRENCIEYIVAAFKAAIYETRVLVSRISPPLESATYSFYDIHDSTQFNRKKIIKTKAFSFH